MERSHIPLHKWLYAMYLLVTARKGISSLQLAKEIGVTQKTAWFLLHRLREACGGRNLRKLRGIIEIDETFVGGLEGNKHANKKLHAGRGPVGKTAVLGMKERGGRMQARLSGQMTFDEIHGDIHANIEAGSQIYTDDSPIFDGLDGLFFRHDSHQPQHRGIRARRSPHEQHRERLGGPETRTDGCLPSRQPEASPALRG
jgi:hypothetical protein